MCWLITFKRVQEMALSFHLENIFHSCLTFETPESIIGTELRGRIISYTVRLLQTFIAHIILYLLITIQSEVYKNEGITHSTWEKNLIVWPGNKKKALYSLAFRHVPTIVRFYRWDKGICQGEHTKSNTSFRLFGLNICEGVNMYGVLSVFVKR